jgi:predicted alpha-1,6-mannanase (GH76 family)
MDWTKEAEAATRYCLKSFWDDKANRFCPATPMKSDALPWDFMWANGVAFSMLVGAVRHNPRYYRPHLDRFFDGMEGYWDKNAPIPAYDAYLASPTSDDKYYDDNAWMVITFAEAYTLTQERRFLTRAIATMQYVLSGWDSKLGGGIYWRQDHKSKNTCSNAPTAYAALVLFGLTKKPTYKEWAERIVDWTQRTLQAPNGLYWDNQSIENQQIEKTQWTYNTALMIRSHVALSRATGEKRHLDEALRLARASEENFVRKETGAFRDEANFSHLLCEAFLDVWRETKEPWLLRRVEANGEFVLRHLRDKDGGFWTEWRIKPDRNEPRKTLMANASTTRLLWVLAEATNH